MKPNSMRPMPSGVSPAYGNRGGGYSSQPAPFHPLQSNQPTMGEPPQGVPTNGLTIGGMPGVPTNGLTPGAMPGTPTNALPTGVPPADPNNPVTSSGNMTRMTAVLPTGPFQTNEPTLDAPRQQVPQQSIPPGVVDGMNNSGNGWAQLIGRFLSGMPGVSGGASRGVGR